MKYLKSYNESIRHLLKPKNDEEINKKLDNLNPQQKLEKGCEYDQLWLVKMALKEGADPSDNYNYPITISVVNDSIDVVKFLLKDNRVDPSDGNDMCIRHATTYSNIDMVKELLKHPKVNPFHSTKVEFVENVIKSAFQIAVEDNDIELIQLFLNDYRAKKYLSEDFYNKNIKYYFNKNESIRHLLKGKDLKDIKNNINYYSIVKYDLHEYFTDDELVNYIKIDHSLMYMVKQGLHFNRFGLIKYAIQNGFNINNLKERLFIRSPKIKTTSNILECSISKNNDIKIIELLLDNGAKINDDCYDFANFYNRNDIIKLLNQYNKTNESIRHLLKGKDLNDVLKNNEIKPLDKIASGCQYGILSLVKDTIEDKEFNINDLNGFDFIIYSATINNHIDIVEYLLKNTNLDPTIYNNASIENAYINDNVEMVELLLNDDRVRNSLPKFKVNDYELLIYKNKKTK
ncbi:ankyrin repeat domain-containing protein [Trichloromonas sp.]|uniref:ankyrin repeat domain-containing protein n=1 Tax=Trichloromonas sp. TaxID=3069249 RepID=UPI002A43F27E|nr:hypothetical protein [Trichloromonas sp.]